jgi:hypothetical protein
MCMFAHFQHKYISTAALRKDQPAALAAAAAADASPAAAEAAAAADAAFPLPEHQTTCQSMLYHEVV